jgi:hypothetical protein
VRIALCELLTRQERSDAFSLVRDALERDASGPESRCLVLRRGTKQADIAYALQARGVLYLDFDLTNEASMYYRLTKLGRKEGYSLIWCDGPDTPAQPANTTYRCGVKTCGAKFPTLKELKEHYSNESYEDLGGFNIREKDPAHNAFRTALFGVWTDYQYGQHPLANEHNDHFATWQGPYSAYRRYNRIGHPVCQWCAMGIHQHGTAGANGVGGGHDCKVLLIEGGQCNCWWGARRN